ncbi:calcium-binding protein [Flavobacterium sp. ABG]|nr:calcium-binding protein [Flavobacterium sp. ABG]
MACSDSSSSEKTDTTAKNNCPTKTCGDFTTQAQAQATFNSNKSCYKNLDADGDGIACENLSK